MWLLLTRPEEDSAELARLLARLGHETVVAPLLAIRFMNDAQIPERNWQALLVTSANGARALGRLAAGGRMKAVPVLAVGEASAEAVAAEGFTQVHAADGDVDALAALAVTMLDPAGGPLLHAAGSVVAGDLASVLGARGFEVERVVLYEAEKAPSLPGEVVADLKEGAIDGVLFYSPRTARHFVQLAQEAGIDKQLGSVTAYCLSQAVADALKPVAFKAVKTAPEPSQKALLALISA